ncbi:hypothetical protein Bca52824_051418 [Brassica carinata]|uniref:Uncharacterized protein n=1 Tax=Brassica carinata TaxID=52824 RepID=A0A8X7R2W9_BRACI|nr:hypothetical protein Bca52824_051418 [Brassica carinata]
MGFGLEWVGENLSEEGEWTMILAGFQTKLGLSRRGGVSSVVSETSPESGAREVCLESKTLLLVLERYQDGGLRDWWEEAAVSSHSRESRGDEEMDYGVKSRAITRYWCSRRSWFNGKEDSVLLELGYKENSEEIEKALRCFRGRGSELRERFDFPLSLGLSEREAKDMDVLTQASDVLETKVNYLVNELGYPLSTLVAFPSCLKYTLGRMKLRFAMYYWLQDRGKADAKLAISTILEELKKTASLCV